MSGPSFDDIGGMSVRSVAGVGATLSRVKAAATTNATLLKGGTGRVLSFALYNNASASRAFKFYDKATIPVPGTDIPKFTVILPAAGGANIDLSGASGLEFSAGIGYAITANVADSDTTAVALDDVHGFVSWK